MLYSLFIVLLAGAMIGALGYSLYALVRYQGKGPQLFRGLALRVGLGALLLAFLLLGLATGLLRPSAPWNEVHTQAPVTGSIQP